MYPQTLNAMYQFFNNEIGIFKLVIKLISNTCRNFKKTLLFFKSQNTNVIFSFLRF